LALRSAALHLDSRRESGADPAAILAESEGPVASPAALAARVAVFRAEPVAELAGFREARWFASQIRADESRLDRQD